MNTSIENRGYLPPEKEVSGRGYMETEVCMVNKGNVLPENDDFLIEVEEWAALNILFDADERIATAFREELTEMLRSMFEMRSEQIKKARQRRHEKIFEITMTIILFAEIIAAICIS